LTSPAFAPLSEHVAETIKGLAGLSSQSRGMRTREIAVVAGFTALAVASDFALADLPNVKLVDPIVFSVAFIFGLEMGVYVGVLSEVIWGTLSPYGFGGYIIPFLVAGEVLYALAGWGAAKVWKGESSRISARNFYVGAILAICAFLWDLETNAGTALLIYWPSPTLQNLLGVEAVGIPFMVAHELGDLAAGVVLVPLLIFYASRFGRPTARSREA
jgi:hypothetical protein